MLPPQGYEHTEADQTSRTAANVSQSYPAQAAEDSSLVSGICQNVGVFGCSHMATVARKLMTLLGLFRK
jgi:hypothetical protein